MMRSIYIHDKKHCYQISRQVETIDGLPIHYGPVFTIKKEDFTIDLFSEAIFKSFDFAGIKLKLPPFCEDREGYQEYKKNLLKEYGERSFQQLAKKATLYTLDWEGNSILFIPSIYHKGGSIGDEDHYKSFSIRRKHKIQIAQEILDLINEYKSIKNLS